MSRRFSNSRGRGILKQGSQILAFITECNIILMTILMRVRSIYKRFFVSGVLCDTFIFARTIALAFVKNHFIRFDWRTSTYRTATHLDTSESNRSAPMGIDLCILGHIIVFT